MSWHKFTHIEMHLGQIDRCVYYFLMKNFILNIFENMWTMFWEVSILILQSVKICINPCMSNKGKRKSKSNTGKISQMCLKVFSCAPGSSMIKAVYLSTLQFSKLVDIQSGRLQSSLFISILALNCIALINTCPTWNIECQEKVIWRNLNFPQGRWIWRERVGIYGRVKSETFL